MTHTNGGSMIGKWTKENFNEHHINNPEIYNLFIKFAKMAAQHKKYYSAKAIFHRIRWETMVSGEGDYKIDDRWRLLESGMVTTIEPGIYISPSNSNVPKKWRGIGVRIEDDVLVTKSGHKVLSTGIPKTVQEIESYMSVAH